MKNFFVMLAVISMSSSAFAYDVSQVMSHLKDKERLLAKVKFDFHQEVEFTDMNKTSVVEGEAVIAKDGKMKISKTAPEKQFTISNGKKMWIYTPAYGQVWEGRWKGWAANSMLPKGMLPVGDYAADLEKNFELTLASASDTEVEVVAHPKDKSADYTLNFLVSTDSWLPVQTSFVSDSAKIVTKLSHFEENPSISDSVFNFNPPAGTDVIPMN